MTLRKVIKTRGSFPSEEANDIATAWTGDSRAVILESDLYGKLGISRQPTNSETLEPLVVGPKPAWLCLASASELDNAIERQETGVKTLVPEEEGDYKIDLSKYPQFEVWRSSRRDLRVDGKFTYGLDSRDFMTTFEARFGSARVRSKMMTG